MTAIKISIQDKTPELFQKLQAGIGRFVVKGASYVGGQLRDNLQKPASGKVYNRKFRSHTASAPGHFPATDSDNLMDSIAVIMENSLEAKIGTPVEYSLYLETGTSRMGARPLWERTAKEVLPTLDAMLAGEIGAGRGSVGV